MMNLGGKTPCPLYIDPCRLVGDVLSAPYILFFFFWLTLLLFLMNPILYICHNKMGFKPDVDCARFTNAKHAQTADPYNA